MVPEINNEIVSLLRRAVGAAVDAGQLPPAELCPLELEIPRNRDHGDLSSTIAIKMARHWRRPPASTAEALAGYLRSLVADSPSISSVEADPRIGFINFTLSPAALRDTLRQVLQSPGRWGETDSGGGKKVLIEFVSANPTGPLTVAHGRQAAVGDALARIMEKSGFKVGREYYLNDRGRQMEILGESVCLRWKEFRGGKIDYPESHYRGDYIIELAREIPGRLEGEGRGPEELEGKEAVAWCRRFAAGRMLDSIRKDLADFRVEIETWTSETGLVEAGLVDRILSELGERGATYEKEGALWFRSSDFGDEKDRVLRKSDGELTYLTSDIAYHREKFRRGYDLLIDFWGPDHHGYIARLKGAMAALGYDPARLEVVIVQLCTLYEGEKQLRMSTRAGEFVSLREVMDAVGVDAARYFFVRRRKESHLDFDLELARRKSLDNPVYYVQYACARISSVFKRYLRKGGRSLPEFAAADLDPLKDPVEMDLIKKLLQFPAVVSAAAASFQPQLIPNYLEDLAGGFHSYYNRCRVLGGRPALTAARLALLRAVRGVLEEGLELLGVAAPEEM